jgi:hypothetical protein
MLTDELERRLIQQEIDRQLSLEPLFDLKRVATKIAGFFGYARQEGTLTAEARTATN